MDSADTSSKRPRSWEEESESSTAVAAAEYAAPAAAAAAAAPPPASSIDEEEAVELIEANVGITHYVAPQNLGFAGVLKQRFSDFLVHEIDQRDGVVHLTNTGVPPIFSAISASSGSVGSDKQKLEELLGASVAAQLDSLGTGAKNDAAGAPAELLLDAPEDKSKRRVLHELIRAVYPSLESNHYAGGSAAAPLASIRVNRKGASSGPQRSQHHHNNSNGSGRQELPASLPAYVQFVLVKSNWETPAALTALANAAGIRSSDPFSYAGLKDRRGVTTQLVTAWKVHPATLLRGAAFMRGSIRVGNFQPVADKLFLGYLNGNRFTLTIRNVGSQLRDSDGSANGAQGSEPPTAPAAAAALAAWSRSSFRFVNYFGLQRFGSGHVRTHEVGRALLQGRYIDAVYLILEPCPAAFHVTRTRGDARNDEQYRDVFAKTGDAKAALGIAPRSAALESGMLRAIAANSPPRGKGASTVGGAGAPSPPPPRISHAAACAALGSLPTRMRMLYLHAYQSVLWNSLASQRVVGEDAMRPVAGDLVPVDPKAQTATGAVGDAAVQGAGETAGSGASGASAVPASASEPAGDAAMGAEPRLAAGGSSFSSAAAAAPGAATAVPARLKFGEVSAVRALTPADISAGTYAITDILIPQPGFSVVYPSGGSCSLEAVAAMLRRDGFEIPSGLDRPALLEAVAVVWKPRHRDYQLPGDYRHVVSEARDVQWCFVRHALPDADLTPTELENVPEPGAAAGASQSATLSPSLPAAGAEAAGRLASSSSSIAAPTGPEGELPTSPCEGSEGAFVALRIAFSLAKSTYATMALRELMRNPTGKQANAALNAAKPGSLNPWPPAGEGARGAAAGAGACSSMVCDEGAASATGSAAAHAAGAASSPAGSVAAAAE